MRLAAATVVVWLLLAMLGELMTPAWSSTHMAEADHLPTMPSDTTIAASDPGVGTGTPMGTYAVRESTISIPLTDAVSVNAIVREPVDAPGDRPAVLMLQGAGTGRAVEVYGDIAPQLASAGIVTMVPDKRLDDYSLSHRDYRSMAHDYERELDVLRTRPGVDASRTGVYAESEGTWISAVMTSERPDIAFSVIVSAPVYSGRTQMTMAADTYFETTGVPDQVTGDIPKLAALDFSLAGRNLIDYADFDATRDYSRLARPALVVYGTSDPSMSVEQGALRIRELAADGSGNRNVTLRYYPTNHQMRLGSAISKPGLALDPAFVRDVASWIGAAAAGTDADGWRTPMTAGSQPDQRFAVHTGPMSAGTLAPRSFTQLAVPLIGGPLLLAAAAVAACTMRVRRATQVPPVPRGRLAAAPADVDHPVRGFGSGATWRLWALGGSAMAVLLAMAAYLGFVVVSALRLESDPPLFDGGWLALRVLGIALAALWATTLLRLWDGRDARHRHLHRSVRRRIGRTGHDASDGASDSPSDALPDAESSRRRHGARAPFAVGAGAWTTTALTLAGAALTTGALTFLGLFAL